MELRIATCRPLPEPDPDEELLLAVLAERGVRARMADWRDPRERWEAPVPTVIRSTWDYHRHAADFLEWLDRAARTAPMWNPPGIARWNAHKSYLLDLDRRGCAIVPTELVARGSTRTLADVLDARGWNDAVLKPAVGAASHGALRVRRDDVARGEAHLAELCTRGDVLVQGYVPAVETSGERAIVWVDGELTHAVRKNPRFSGQEERVSAAVAIAPDERNLAMRALAPFEAHARERARGARELLYARVDVVRDADGVPRIMELELIEPSLFLTQYPPALERLVQGLVTRLRAPR
jgi:glutathione synthase/RimK-type ligase-like ATP-grasp enzyme